MKDVSLDPALVEDPYPFQEHLGFYLVDWREDYARFELPIREFLGNRYGILHGGVHALMCDTVMGFAGCYTGDPENRKLGMNEGQLPTTSPECVDGSYVGDSGFMLGWERINLTREYRWPKSLA